MRQCSNVAITDNVIVHYPEHDGGYASIAVDAVTEVIPTQLALCCHTHALCAYLPHAVLWEPCRHQTLRLLCLPLVSVQGTEVSNNTFVNLGREAWQLPISVGEC